MARTTHHIKAWYTVAGHAACHCSSGSCNEDTPLPAASCQLESMHRDLANSRLPCLGRFAGTGDGECNSKSLNLKPAAECRHDDHDEHHLVTDSGNLNSAAHATRDARGAKGRSARREAAGATAAAAAAAATDQFSSLATDELSCAWHRQLKARSALELRRRRQLVRRQQNEGKKKAGRWLGTSKAEERRTGKRGDQRSQLVGRRVGIGAATLSMCPPARMAQQPWLQGQLATLRGCGRRLSAREPAGPGCCGQRGNSQLNIKRRTAAASSPVRSIW